MSEKRRLVGLYPEDPCVLSDYILEIESELNRTKEICEMLYNALLKSECSAPSCLDFLCNRTVALQKYEAWKKGESNGK